VVLNEAVVLTKKFCSENSHSFVNAVLDKTAKSVRTLETAQ
jgi:N utilization substance protein B